EYWLVIHTVPRPSAVGFGSGAAPQWSPQRHTSPGFWQVRSRYGPTAFLINAKVRAPTLKLDPAMMRGEMALALPETLNWITKLSPNATVVPSLRRSGEIAAL